MEVLGAAKIDSINEELDTEGRLSPNTGEKTTRKKPKVAPLNMDIVGNKGDEPDELTKELLAAQDSES